MKKILKRGLSLVLTLIMVVGLLPVTAFAAVDSSGRPQDVANKLILAIYNGTGFPGEPAVYSPTSYKNINSKFEAKSGTFASSAKDQLDWNKIEPDLLQGKTSGNTKVWGVYDASGAKDYFLPTASIIQPANEAKIIRAIKSDVANKSDDEVLAKYEIIWYVIKLQHSTSWIFTTTEWHIDGVIKERELFSINYYGNGNTDGDAPTGITDHPSNKNYVVAGPGDMVKVINGASVKFLGWSARADGSGAELDFYQAGDVIPAEELKEKYGGKLSLYAMWDTTTQYTATVNTYLDNVLTDEDDIHGSARDLYLSTDNEHFYKLTRSAEGVYTVKITGNGKFHLFSKDGGNYNQIGTHQLTIYNQNGSLDVHHYSVTYDANGGSCATDPGKKAYNYGESVTAITDTPTKEGYRFLGWKDSNGNLVLPGETVTASIDKPITLTAQWEKTINVTINVTINHEGGGGYDQMATKDDVLLALVSRENESSPYLEVEGKTLNLDKGTVPEDQKVTEYTGNTFNDMPGGEVDYTVVTSKSGYDTKVTEKQDADGNWIIDVVMTYNPSNFDLEFTVEVDKTVPNQYLPDAAIVKVTFWSTDRKQWEIITQQEGGAPGVRVDIDPNTRRGSGSYPVWKYESNGETPYGNRIVVTSFVYPDGTIVPASGVVTQDVAWTDNVYTATVDPVTGGKKYGELYGAYYDQNTDSQKGTLNAVITMDLHDVTFDAQGGQVNGQTSQTVEKQYKIPAFKNYVPTRDGGYIFDGWYLEADCINAATEGVDLTEDITLYAKWIAPLTISGTVTISGTYMQNGEKVSVHDIDRATEAVVVLQEVRNGTAYDVDSQTVSFGNYQDSGSADYSFSPIPNDGKQYQIHVLVLNYGTGYDNESDTNSEYTPNEYTAEFNGDDVADVDAYLEFVPPSYDQPLKVDATRIGETFRPKNVLSEVMYRDTGDNHAFQRISQHDVEPYGVVIGLTNGTGNGQESIWKWHTDGTLYDYQMNITKVDGAGYDSDTAPFYITYEAPAYWNGNTNAPSGDLEATLIPKQYQVTFELNAGSDTVTGMDAFKLTYTDEEGNEVVTSTYGVVHTWSFDTAINAVPQREGYTFTGWQADVENEYADGKISAAIHQEVTLTAQWEKSSYTVTTAADPAEGGTTTGDGTYAHGERVTVKATAQTGYNFCGWYEGETSVSEAEDYTFAVTSNRNLVARFAKNPYMVEANTTTGGTAAGTGIYEYGQTATVTATPEDGYAFRGWYEGTEKVSEAASYSFTVTADRTLTAQFSKVYTVKVITETGGSVSGGGAYEPMANATITATANGGYYFVGWYDEKDELVTAETSYSLTVKEDRTFTAKFEKKVSYKCDYVYIFGYNDSEIGATGPLLRGELAQMIYRLVKQNKGVSNGGNSFRDTAGEWFESGISYMAEVGAIDRNSANAYPYASVSSGETYKMICLGLGFTKDTSLDYSDYKAILSNSNLPANSSVTSKIQRYQFCELFNAILGRSNYCQDGCFDTNGNEVTAETYGYTDLKPSDSYYRTMMIATSTFTNGKIDLEKRIERNTYDYTN